MQWTPLFSRSSDQGEVLRKSIARIWRAPLRTSSRQRAAPTKPRPPVTTKVLPSMPSFSLKCIFPIQFLLGSDPITPQCESTESTECRQRKRSWNPSPVPPGYQSLAAHTRSRPRTKEKWYDTLPVAFTSILEDLTKPEKTIEGNVSPKHRKGKPNFHSIKRETEKIRENFYYIFNFYFLFSLFIFFFFS